MESRFARGWRSRCRVAATLAVMAMGLVLGAGGVSPAIAGQEGNHCITPDGIDLNERYGVSAQLVSFFCPEVGAGEQWTVGAVWLVNSTFDAVPDGFVAAGDTPLADFLTKFIGVRYVVDPGTAHEETYVFPNGDKLWIGVIDGLSAVNSLTLGTLNPLPVGDHVVELYWVFSAMHCDGLAAVIEENCLPAGETLYRRTEFEVTPGHYA